MEIWKALPAGSLPSQRVSGPHCFAGPSLTLRAMRAARAAGTSWAGKTILWGEAEAGLDVASWQPPVSNSIQSEGGSWPGRTLKPKALR